jgi:hypothetical protein
VIGGVPVAFQLGGRRARLLRLCLRCQARRFGHGFVALGRNARGLGLQLLELDEPARGFFGARWYAIRSTLLP